MYTGIPGSGLFAISPDLETWTPLNAHDGRLKANIHGLVAFVDPRGRKRIAVAQNDEQRVLVLDAADGRVLQVLEKPRGGEFGGGRGAAEANAYYSARRRHVKGDGNPSVFAVTDVTYLDGKLYCVTGYCDGDFVLTAELHGEGGEGGEGGEEGEEGEGSWRWGTVAWGGKGTGAGQFTTAHGVTAHDGHIYVANRESFQVVKFRPDGSLVEVLPDIPHGSRICNVAKAQGSPGGGGVAGGGAAAGAAAATATAGGHFYMNALAPLGKDGSSDIDSDSYSGSDTN